MDKKALVELFRAFQKKSVLIIGDVMLDAYLFGKVERISPEAPVPVVSVSGRDQRPGGAANVALNIHSLGAKPILVSVIGQDEAGTIMVNLMKKAGMSIEGLISLKGRPTTVKTRVIGGNHQMMRIDEETDKELEITGTKLLIAKIKKVIQSQKPDVIIFEDYDKGVITEELIKEVISLSKKYSIPVAVDPKKRNFLNYKGVSLLKPNIREFLNGTKSETNPTKPDALLPEISRFIKAQSIGVALITLSENGVLVCSAKMQKIIPAHVRSIADVSGAGDTVISVAALCLACRTDLTLLAGLSNLAGGLVCESSGVVPIQAAKLLEEAIEKV